MKLFVHIVLIFLDYSGDFIGNEDCIFKKCIYILFVQRKSKDPQNHKLTIDYTTPSILIP